MQLETITHWSAASFVTDFQAKVEAEERGSGQLEMIVIPGESTVW